MNAVKDSAAGPGACCTDREKPMKRVAFLLAFAVLTLSACTTMRATTGAPQLDAQLCNSPNIHCRKVTIRNGQIDPVPDVVVTSPNSQIYWEIVTDGFEFDRARGIAFKPGQVIPPGEFQCNRMLSTVFHCSDAKNTRAKYLYAIRVTDGSTPIELDPQIFND